MAPLVQQAGTAIGFSLRTCCPLAGREIVTFAAGALTLDSVLAELDATVQYLAALPAPVISITIPQYGSACRTC